MKKSIRTLTFISLFLSLSPALRASESETLNILFMGNSFTFRHNIPKLVKTVFEEGKPGLKVHTDLIGYGGQDLFRHYELYRSQSMVRLNSITIPEIEAEIEHIKSLQAMPDAPQFYVDYWAKAQLKPQPWDKLKRILQRAEKVQEGVIKKIGWDKRVKWDYLVLQSYRDIVDDVDAGYAEYAAKWAQLAKEEGIKVILYITAPHAQNEAPVSEPVEPGQTEMEIQTIHQLVKRIRPHAVVPVPLAIKNIQEGGTDLTFRYENDFHPNQTTAFLTANMFYAAFYGESTEGFDFNTVTETKLDESGKDPDGGDASVVFSPATKELLQKAAFEAVSEFRQSD